MVTMTATEFSRNLSRVLDRLEQGGEEVVVMRNHRVVARLSPGAPGMTAREAFSDLEGLLSEAEGAAWLVDCKGADRALNGELRDPWAQSSTRRSGSMSNADAWRTERSRR